jgi:hypothetical protein
VFQSAEGLEAGKAKINYGGFDIGVLSTIRLSEDQQRVIAKAQMAPRTEDFLVEDTRLWVVRPRISGANVTGLGTLISGGLYRDRNRPFKGAQARLRGARDSAGDNRQCAWTFLRAEDLRPRVAGHPLP